MIKRIAVYLTAFLMTSSALGLTDEERQALFHIHQELTALEQWIAQAEQSANQQNPHSFDYSQLRRDISRIREGISDATNKTRREPRELPPIQGGY